jgi:hypothetical protein
MFYQLKFKKNPDISVFKYLPSIFFSSAPKSMRTAGCNVTSLNSSSALQFGY